MGVCDRIVLSHCLRTLDRQTNRKARYHRSSESARIAMKKRHKIAWVAASGVLILVLVLAFRPTPIVVETATVSVGPLLETLDEEGKTRMHDRFVLTATIVGKLRRIELHAGDRVRTGEVVAWIDPAPIEPRETAVLRARLEFAKALQREADALVRRAQAEHDQAASDLNRSRTLFD